MFILEQKGKFIINYLSFYFKKLGEKIKVVEKEIKMIWEIN